MHSLRVLIVEDQKATAALLGKNLAMFRVGSVVVGTLRDALAALKTCDGCDRFSCILLDLTLPDAGGVEAVEAICEKCEDTPVIVVTGDGDAVLPAIKAGAQDALTKPVDMEDLVLAIRKGVARQIVDRRYRPMEEALERAETNTQQIVDRKESSEEC